MSVRLTLRPFEMAAAIDALKFHQEYLSKSENLPFEGSNAQRLVCHTKEKLERAYWAELSKSAA